MKLLNSFAQHAGVVVILFQAATTHAQNSDGFHSSILPMQVQGKIEDQALHFSYSTVTLTDGRTIRGAVALHRSADVLILTYANKTIPAMQVQSLEVAGQQGHVIDLRKYYDFALMRQGYFPGNPNFVGAPERRHLDEFGGKLQRLYKTYRWNRDNEYSNYLVPGFFEQLSSGPVVLLYRTSLKLKTINEMAFADAEESISPPAFKIVEKGKFYLGLADGRAVLLRKPQAEVLSYFQAQSAQITEFAQQHNLRFTKAHELAYIVNYANYLAQAAQFPPK